MKEHIRWWCDSLNSRITLKQKREEAQRNLRSPTKVYGRRLISNRMAENLGVKNAKWDKKDGYFVPRDCYNSYFYLVESENTSLIEKLILHGEKLTKYLDGGSAFMQIWMST